MSRHRVTYYAFNLEGFAKVKLLADERELVRKHADFLLNLGRFSGRDKYADLATVITLNSRAFCGIAHLKDKPLFIGGYFEIAPGVYQVFVIPDESIYKAPLVFHLTVKEIIKSLEDLDWTRRLQTFSLPIARIDRWMKALGFLCEGDTNSYTEDGQKYKLWSRSK